MPVLCFDLSIPGLYLSPGFLIYSLLLLAIFITGSIYYSVITKAFRILIQMVFCVFASALLSKIVLFFWQTNHPVFHILLLLQLLYFGAIFKQLFKKNIYTQTILSIGALVFFLIAIINLIMVDNIFTFPSSTALLLSLYVTLACIILFYRMISSPVDIPILKQSLFWFATGSLFFYTITFFILGYYKFFLMQLGKMPQWTHWVLYGANYMLYSSYLIAVILEIKNKPSENEP